ncbi:hypothetical protein HY969_00455 [Candidatus Kaiserbacteria bacterium]|nr:hypothetical protein [Candidatus Kaiserbacteria bacterium]
MNKKLYIASAFCLTFLPIAASAASPRTYRELVVYIVNIMNYAVGTLIILGLVIYLFGAARNILKAKDGDSSASRKFLLMGIAILFVMVSIWGILELLQNTFLSGGLFDPGGGEETIDDCAFGDPSCSIGF